ncbi:hypothetical protein HF329_05595 [Chitinophaga oryzae]|uniref:Uncharacterized protein n=1 Tax=Chitinophaga oryzae TaxID=2725414 RepID=A0AAE6ZDR8_9BACT|nr:hypothetical protein [Chitinophaga oryzae]QJB30799.1 hypothetical protein HF329_05595 [Chitinophaga oryzae]
MRILLVFIYLLLFGINFSCGSPNLVEKKQSIDTSGVYGGCSLFVKAISTKDTSLFYKVVDGEKLVAYLNKKHPHDLINKQDLFFPFFFVFSPLKIRKDFLILKRDKDLFRMFKIERVDYLPGDEVKVDVSWITTMSTDSQQISLTLVKEVEEWKVVGADWKELGK